MIEAPPRPGTERRSRWGLPVVGLAILAVAGYAVLRARLEGAPPRQRFMPTVPVSAAVATSRTVPLALSIPGTVEPYASVSVRALVSGQLETVGFQQGKPVERGQLLFQIDPRPYQAALTQQLAIEAKDQAQVGQLAANLARDVAQSDNAEKEARRYAALLKLRYVSREQSDQYAVSATAATSTVAADRAALEAARSTADADRSAIATARLNLGYTRITAPISGVAGQLLVDPGNLVKTGDSNPLVTLNQIQPIYVSFPLTQDQFALLRQYRHQGAIAVQTVPGGGSTGAAENGTLAFTNNTVDPTTGTITAQAVFANADRQLWPGTYVHVKVQLAKEADRIVVPAAAISTGQNGQYVYAIQPDHKVAMQPVTVERNYDGMAIVKTGIAAGQRVVTDGQLELTNGARVKVIGR